VLNPVPPMTAQSLILGPFELLPAAGAEARSEAALAREQGAVASGAARNDKPPDDNCFTTASEPKKRGKA
jgi:hypothetical protein